MEVLSGKKSFLMGLGLIGLGAYNISQGDVSSGIQNILQGGAIIALRLGIAKGG